MTQPSSKGRAGSVIDAMRDQIHTTRMPARRRVIVGTSASLASTLPVLVAVAVAVLVAAAALIAFRQGGTPSPMYAAPTTATSVQTSRQELIRLLGVLRRPQTRADLDPQVPYVGLGRTWGYPELDLGLARVVPIPAWHARIVIDPATYQPSLTSAQRSEGVDLAMEIGNAPNGPPTFDISGPRPYSAATVLARGLALSDPPSGKTIVVVPDGVARVTLQPIRLTPPQIRPGVPHPPAVQPGDFASVTAAVHDNVAPFELTVTVVDPHAHSGTFVFVAVARATWFDGKGHVIRETTTTDLELPVNVRARR